MVKTHEIQGRQTFLSCILCAGVFRALLKKSFIVFSAFVMMTRFVLADTPTGYMVYTDFPAMIDEIMIPENYMQPSSVYKDAAVAANMLGITEGTIDAVPVYLTVSCSANQYLNENTCKDCPSGYPNSVSGATSITQCYKMVDIPCTQNECSNPDTTGCASVTCAASCSCDGGQYKQYSNSAGTGDGETSGTMSQSCTKSVATLSANSNHYVDGTNSCPVCNEAFKNGGTDTSNGTCPDGTVKSNAVATSQTYTQTCYHQTSSGGNIDSSLCTGTQSCGAKNYGACTITGCASGYYLSDGACVGVGVGYYSADGEIDRIKCPDEYPNTDNTTAATITACYKMVTRGCTQNPCVCSEGAMCACANCACAGETYIQYVASDGESDGVTSGNTENEICNQTVVSTKCDAGYYMKNNVCTACPKGTYKAEIGNATSCTVASEGYYVSITGATSQTQCPEGYRDGSNRGRDDITDCYKNVTRGCTQNACTCQKDSTCTCADCVCAGGTYMQYVASDGKSYGATSGTTLNEKCNQTVAMTTCKAGYYMNDDICTACPKGTYKATAGNATSCTVASEDHYVSTTGATSQTQCYTGLVSPQGTTSASGCGKMMYVDGTKLYLTSEKQTSPALAVRINGVVYYANITPLSSGAKTMNAETTKSLRTRINGIEYSIHDNTVQEE